MKKNIIGALIAAAVMGLSFNGAEAAGNCSFNDNFKELYSAQAALRLNENQENILKELSIRKKIIGRAISCSIDEALSSQSELRIAETNSQDLSGIKNRIISKFDEIIGYYQTQNGSVGDLGIAGSKIFSANLKSWRDSNFVPMSDIEKNFLVFLKNQDVIQTAQNRFNQISLTLKTLGLSDNQKISGILNEADKNIQLANDGNNQAEDIFKRLAWPSNVSDIMVSSLQHLKDAYQNFFDIGTEAQNIISSSK